MWTTAPESRVLDMMGNSRKKLTAIDLFCGAGGLTAALSEAGWTTVAAVDADEDCIKTLQANQSRGKLKGAKLIHADIATLSADDLRPARCGKNWRPDLLAGGPPCQPFSSAGLMQGLNDPRGELFTHFVRLANELKPRFILFENVQGLVTAKDKDGHVGGVLLQIQRSFESIGYACRFDLLNAADYGAPQRRVRLYMVASYREALPHFPLPTHGRDGFPAAWLTLGNFLKELPRASPKDIIRPTPAKELELSQLTPGTGLRSSGIVEANRPSGHWGYRQDSFLADMAMPARTIRAASTPDWIRRGRNGKLRRLTWRECAALQGFPSDWEFVGGNTSRFRQIGNAVQGHIGAVLALHLRAAALRQQNALPQSAQWPPSFGKRVRYTAMEDRVNGEHRRVARGEAALWQTRKNGQKKNSKPHVTLQSADSS